MRKMFFYSALTIAMAFGSASAKGKYGSAGCGLGSMIFGDQKGMIQLVASTFNGTSGNQSFAITSGTLNCADDGVAMADKEKEFFANANFESLKQEMAQGQGENLAAFASLYGCNSGAFAQTVKANYGKILPEGANSTAMLENLDTVVGSDASLAGACHEMN